MIKLELEVVEVNEILMALQTHVTGISSLANKIKAQGDSQVAAPAVETPAEIEEKSDE